MAKASIKCTCPECGATHYWSITCHNRREADNWEEYHAGEANTRLCPECYRKARNAAYKTRETPEAKPEPKKEHAGMRLAVPCVPEGQTRCPNCGYPVSRISSTRRYSEFSPQVIIRYRNCRKCNFRFASRAVID